MFSDAKILVFNQERQIVDWLRTHLDAEGFGVLAASDGFSALDLLHTEAPVLVLMDAILASPAPQSMDGALGPHMDGCQLLRRLRLESNVGVIVLSRERHQAIKLYFLDSGADDYVIWPCDRRKLLARMRAVVRRTHHKTQRWERGYSHGLQSRHSPSSDM
jgi:DNA-binding response OmpR family regulator